MIKITEDGSQDKIVFGDGGDIDYEFSGTGAFKFTTDNTDHAIQQHDGNEVARIHDGGATNADNDMTSIGHGFGFKRPMMNVTADSADVTVTLDDSDSGAIIQCDADTNNITFVLPVINAAAKAGLTYTFVTTTAVHGSKTITIRTGGGAADDADKFLLYGFNGATSITDVAGDVLKIPSSAAIGTVVRVTCLTSGESNAAELWLAEVFGASAVTNTANQSSAALLSPEVKHVTLTTVPIAALLGIFKTSPATSVIEVAPLNPYNKNLSASSAAPPPVLIVIVLLP
jgi:hypothetical protein